MAPPNKKSVFLLDSVVVYFPLPRGERGTFKKRIRALQSMKVFIYIDAGSRASSIDGFIDIKRIGNHLREDIAFVTLNVGAWETQPLSGWIYRFLHLR